MNRDLPCPECGADWRAKEIPLESLRRGGYGPWNEGDPPRYFYRLVGIELPYDDPNHYDGISFWMCPDCGAQWNRFTGELVAGTGRKSRLRAFVERIRESLDPDLDSEWEPWAA